MLVLDAEKVKRQQDMTAVWESINVMRESNKVARQGIKVAWAGVIVAILIGVGGLYVSLIKETKIDKNQFNRIEMKYEQIPTQARAQLKEGYNTTFKNGQVWTLKDGQPVRVK